MNKEFQKEKPLSMIEISQLTVSKSAETGCSCAVMKNNSISQCKADIFCPISRGIMVLPTCITPLHHRFR